MYSRDEMPDRFWAFENCPGSGAIPRSGVWIEEQSECPFASPQYIRGDLYLADIADRDAEIARLQAELVAKDDAWIADQTNNANEIIRLGDKLERLQARLGAGPTREFMDRLANDLNDLGLMRHSRLVFETANRMEEAANGK